MTPSVFDQDAPRCGFCGHHGPGDIEAKSGIGLRCRNAFQCAKRSIKAAPQ